MNIKILTDMLDRLKKLPQDVKWDAERMNQTCSEYLFEMKTFNNEDVFYLIRYALTGNPVGAPIGEIAEVISRKEV